MAVWENTVHDQLLRTLKLPVREDPGTAHPPQPLHNCVIRVHYFHKVMGSSSREPTETQDCHLHVERAQKTIGAKLGVRAFLPLHLDESIR